MCTMSLTRHELIITLKFMFIGPFIATDDQKQLAYSHNRSLHLYQQPH